MIDARCCDPVKERVRCATDTATTAILVSPKIRNALEPTLKTLHTEPCSRYVASVLDHNSRRLFRSRDRRMRPLSQMVRLIGSTVAGVDSI